MRWGADQVRLQGERNFVIASLTLPATFPCSDGESFASQNQ